MVKASSNKKVWWQCKKGHEWEATVGSRAMGTGCPYCSGTIASPDNNLQILFPEQASYWHPTGILLKMGI